MCRFFFLVVVLKTVQEEEMHMALYIFFLIFKKRHDARSSRINPRVACFITGAGRRIGTLPS